MVFLWFSYGFPMVFPYKYDDSPTIQWIRVGSNAEVFSMRQLTGTWLLSSPKARFSARGGLVRKKNVVLDQCVLDFYGFYGVLMVNHYKYDIIP